LSLYSIEFDSRALEEARELSPRLRFRLKNNLEYLRAGPFRSHPGVLVKEIRELRGLWRFHLDRRTRVFYTTAGDRLLIVMIEQSVGVTHKTVRELGRRL
jgi:mRNA-degrading endonuclease RelE of RelBE toxin-antitoxin system